MDHFQTSEGKLLYVIYNLYKQNKISIDQRNEIKDMLITNDIRIKQILLEIEKGMNIYWIEKQIDIINLEESSPRDLDDTLSNTYKNKRPKLFKFDKSNFSKFLDMKNSGENEFHPNQERKFRPRGYSMAADSQLLFVFIITFEL